MANQEHLDILKQGVGVWNQWRKEHPEIEPDLERAWLGSADLQGCNLSNTNLTGATLSVANLREANLHEANLKDTMLDRADLTEANLTGATLFYTYLSNADLSGGYLHRVSGENTVFSAAFFKGADLSHAFFTGCNFEDASFISANLHGVFFSHSHFSGYRHPMKGTDYSGANLSGADFGGLDLSEANFTRTNLTNAVLRGVNLDKAILKGTILKHVDLKRVKGLETIRYQGTSFIDECTVERSAGTLPETFLRGIGASESLIEYARSLSSISTVPTPARYYSCFISHSSKDRPFAQRLHDDLESKGVHCWFAPEDLKIGDHYRERIKESIRSYEKLVLILSEYAVQSDWIETEVEAAREREMREQRLLLFPVRLDNAVMEATKAWTEDVRQRWHIGDFTQWKDDGAYQRAFERLLRDLKAEQPEDQS